MNKLLKTITGALLVLSLTSGCSLTDNLKSALGLRHREETNTESSVAPATEESVTPANTTDNSAVSQSNAVKADDYIDFSKTSDLLDGQYASDFISIDPGEMVLNSIGNNITLEDIDKVGEFAMSHGASEEVKSSQNRSSDSDSAYIRYSTEYNVFPGKELYVYISKIGRQNMISISYEFRGKTKEECISGMPIVLDYMKNITNIDLSESKGIAQLIEKYNNTTEDTSLSYSVIHGDTFDSINIYMSQYHWESLDDSFTVKGTLNIEV